MNVSDYGLAMRSKAIGMIESGLPKKEVAKRLNVGYRSVRRWSQSNNSGVSLETKGRSGRPPILDRVSKIVIAKSLGKRLQSTRKIAKKLRGKGYTISPTTVYRHLKDHIGARSYKRPKRPRITDRIKEKRLSFALAHQHWTVDDWKKVLWSDESPFELFASPNPQNDRVWDKTSERLEPVFKVKFPAKVMVWGMMSHSAVSELHIVPQKQTVNGAYYRDHILKRTCVDAIRRKRKTGGICERAMLQNMSNFLFMQDGAPAHTANLTQAWCSKNFPRFWKKGEWPGNSPDLNPIENLWAILSDRLDEMGQICRTEDLISRLKIAWSSIDPKFLNNLVEGMPKRIAQVIESNGDYIHK